MARQELAPRASRFLTIASVCVVVAALYLARDVLVLLAVAVLLTFLLAPLVHRLERLHLPRVLASVLVVACALIMVGLIGWLISAQVTELAERLTTYRQDIETKIEHLESFFGHGPIAKVISTFDEVARQVAHDHKAPASNAPPGTQENPEAVTIVSSNATPQSIFNILGDALDLLAPMAKAFVVMVFVVFMLVQREDLRDRVIRLVGHGQLTLTTKALDDAATRVSGYLVSECMVNGSMGVCVGVGLFLLRVPNAPLWGLLCGLMRFIPYVGIWIAASFPIVLSIVVPEHDYAARPFLTVGMFVGLEATAANVAEPLLFHSSTGISSLAVLVAAVFWTWLWGGVGLLLSTPMTVVLAVVGKYVPQLQFLDVLLGSEPVLAPPERYYQRLLADDPEEAEDLLEEFEKTRTTVQLDRDILLPALAMVERDHRLGAIDDEQREAIHEAIKNHLEAHAGRRKAPETKVERPFAIPRGCTVNVLCVPAHDEADELAMLMLADLLQDQGYCVHQVTKDALASEMVDAVDRFKANVVVISALPPGAAAHARYIIKRLTAQHSDLLILVGLWGVQGDLEKMRSRIAPDDENVLLSADLEDALRQIHQLAQPLLVRASEQEQQPEQDHSPEEHQQQPPPVTPSSPQRRP